jgi:hypothetical protein
MAAALSFTPASGSIIHVGTVVRVNVTGADTNDASTYSSSTYPTETPYSYFIRFRKSGVDDKKSYVFNVASDGTHAFNNFVFDAAGTWTVTLRNAATDAQVATASVVVS